MGKPRADYEEEVALYAEGWGLRALAKRRGVLRKTITTALRLRGVEIRDPDTLKDYSVAIALYRQGHTAREAARISGRSRPSVVRELRRRGILIRDKPNLTLEMRRDQWRAHKKVKRAIEAGKLVQPKTCSDCGREPGLNKRGRSLLHAHHETYDRPLDVIWVCPLCHARQDYILMDRVDRPAV